MNTYKSEIAQQLETLKPLIHLIGSWQGSGSGGYPTMESFNFVDQMTFKLLPSAYEGEPLIHYEEVASVIENGKEEFKHWETGFFRPLPGGEVEFQVVHNTGRIEAYVGKYDFISDDGAAFGLSLKTAHVINAQGLKVAKSSRKVFEFDSGILKCSHAMSTEDVAESTNHLKVELKKVS